MSKTIKKTIAVMLTLAFVLSLLPLGAMADNTGATTVKLGLINPIWVYDSTATDKNGYQQKNLVKNYGTYLQASKAGTENYKSFFQLDFSGYEHLLRDESTTIQLSAFGGMYTTTSYYLGAYNMYILDDKNDVYGEYYEPYVANSSGLCATELDDYVTFLTQTDDLTPFIFRKDTKNVRSETVISSDANMKVLTDALDAAPGNSIVTVQFINNDDDKNPAIIRFGDDEGKENTFLKINCSNSEATPGKYVESIRKEITWDKISSEEISSLKSNLNLSGLSKYKGIDISWSSNNPDAINAETGVVTRTRKEQTACLTANLSYTDYNNNVTTDSVNFDVTIPAVSLEEDPVFDDANDGDTVLGVKSDDKPTYGKMEVLSDGLGGKAAADTYLSYGDVGGIREIPNGTATEGLQDTLEMSVYVPSESEGMELSVFVKNTSSYTWLTYNILPDGLYVKYTSTGLSKITSWKPDRWHSLAFVTPEPYDASSEEHDDEMKVYINGVKTSHAVTVSPSGYATLFKPRLSLLGDVSIDDDPAIYLDNIRIHSTPYAPEYDALDEIVYKDGISENNVITVLGAETLAGLKAGITKNADTEIRVYRNGAPLADEDVILQGDIVIAAARNGSEMERSYNYYTVNVVKYTVDAATKVNGSIAGIFDDDDTISAEFEFENHTADETYDLTMYSAQYKNGELINLWLSEETPVVPGETKNFTCDFADIKDIANSSIKIMLLDANLKPMCKPGKMRYNAENTPTTLWLLGDSIVQTYEDNGDDAIQGWGYHIPEYLNDNVTVKNMAQGGYTTDHYLYPKETEGVNSEKTWETILPQVNSGDYLIVSLGVNDGSAVSEGVYAVPEERFTENIEKIYNDATAKGATVVFATPGPDAGAYTEESFQFWGSRKLYGRLITEFAQLKDAVCVQLGAAVYDEYNKMLAEYKAEYPDATNLDAYQYVKKYFHVYKEDATADKGYTFDTTHHNSVGSKHVAGILAELLRESGSPLGDYVVIPE